MKTVRNGRPEARRSSNKEISALIQKARDQGWTVLHSGSGHLIFRSPDKSVPQVVVASTPSGGKRSIENARAKLKKSGLVMNPRCPSCGGASHPASGSVLPSGEVVCGPCVRRFWSWASEHGKKTYRVGKKGKGSKYIAFPTGITKKNRRRLRRNPSLSTGAMIAIGAGAVLGLVLLSRPAATVVYAPIGAPSPERIAEAVRGNRETEIARMMARRPGLTRAEAEARYDRAVAAITTVAAAFTRPAVSGLGSYYRS